MRLFYVKIYLEGAIMAQYYKLKENELNTDILTYFNITDLNYYEDIYIIFDKDYHKFIKALSMNDTIIISNDSEFNTNPVYYSLKILNNAKVIYLKDRVNILEDESIKKFILSFRGVIICNVDIIDYLVENNIVKDTIDLKENTYVKIDKYGIQNILIYD